MSIKIVLADDHPIVLAGLEGLFSAEKDFKIVARCADGEETISAVCKHRPDILILDIRMPGKNGLVVLQELSKKELPTRTVVLTATLDEIDLLQAMRVGARGIVLKETAPQVLVECVRKVHGGQRWFDQEALGRVLETLIKREADQERTVRVLSPREIEIVRSVVAALQNKQIATKLFISEGTVKVHLHNIYEKLGVTSRLQLVRYAQEKGLV